MSYSGLGIYYNIPTTSTSSLFPDMVLTMDVPMQQIVNDAVNIAYPTMMNRIYQDLPGLVSAAWPTAQAMAQQSLPSLVESAWPTVEAKLPQAWETVKPQILADAKEQASGLAQLGAIAAIATAGIAVAAWWKFRHR